ncbi:hypothetical protein N431DRAFT_30557 [Stipitochalara longipes BDJ]|nr:hypothetical protein N431DRAFT_30557 [Stipitochalara longipes BDJ]
MDNATIMPEMDQTWNALPNRQDPDLDLPGPPPGSHMHRMIATSSSSQGPGQTQASQFSTLSGAGQDDFLHSIYVLREAFRRSSNPSHAEICQLAMETGRQPYQVAIWFSTEREERNLWISQTNLPSPPLSRRFMDQSFNQGRASISQSQQAALEIPPIGSPLHDDNLLGMSSQAIVEPQRLELSSSNLQPNLVRDQDSSRMSDVANTPKRARKQYRSRRSNENNSDRDNRVFGCPTCASDRSLSKNRDEWYRHQKGCHFPPTVWICRNSGPKSCKRPPTKRQDNFRSHLKERHEFEEGHELESELTKRAVKVTGLFHEKCGFCQQDLASWEASMLHIWEHVESGAKMADWTHVCGRDHKLTANVHIMRRLKSPAPAKIAPTRMIRMMMIQILGEVPMATSILGKMTAFTSQTLARVSEMAMMMWAKLMGEIPCKAVPISIR